MDDDDSDRVILACRRMRGWCWSVHGWHINGSCLDLTEPHDD